MISSPNIGALVIIIGFWGIVYYNYSRELSQELQNSPTLDPDTRNPCLEPEPPPPRSARASDIHRRITAFWRCGSGAATLGGAGGGGGWQKRGRKNYFYYKKGSLLQL